MSRDSHQRFLEKSALREAQKAFRSRGVVKREDFLALRVQTVEPWKRIGAIAVGLSFIVVAAWALKKDFNAWAIALFVALAVLFLFVGLLGRKRSVDVVLNATADVLLQRLLDAIF